LKLDSWASSLLLFCPSLLSTAQFRFDRKERKTTHQEKSHRSAFGASALSPAAGRRAWCRAKKLGPWCVDDENQAPERQQIEQLVDLENTAGVGA